MSTTAQLALSMCYGWSAACRSHPANRHAPHFVDPIFGEDVTALQFQQMSSAQISDRLNQSYAAIQAVAKAGVTLTVGTETAGELTSIAGPSIAKITPEFFGGFRISS